MPTTTRRIDRTTDHMCPGLARDIAYFAAQGRSYFRCADDGSGHAASIPVHYTQFSMICQDCRRECLDDTDVADATCDYCGAALDVTRRCRAWLDCGHLDVPLAQLSTRGFCPDCEAVARS